MSSNSDLALKYRPKFFRDVVGQDAAVRTLRQMSENGGVPHAVLFAGHSGAGKTTLARILRSKLSCSDFDFHELNGADARGIDKVREILVRLHFSPLGGACRVYLIDEAHRLTGDAQSALLKPVEEPPDHVYFFFCTTEPRKILRTIRDRCTIIEVRPVAQKLLLELVRKVVAKEKIDTTAGVITTVVKQADGSARRALKALELVRTAEGEEAQLRALDVTNTEKLANDIVTALLWEKTTWPDVAKKLEALDDDPEQLRRYILAVATTVLLKGGRNAKRAAAVLQIFRDDWYSCGKAGLVVSCWEVLGRK